MNRLIYKQQHALNVYYLDTELKKKNKRQLYCSLYGFNSAQLSLLDSLFYSQTNVSLFVHLFLKMEAKTGLSLSA